MKWTFSFSKNIYRPTFTPTVYKNEIIKTKKKIISPGLVPRNSNGEQYVIVICDISTSNKSVAKFSTLDILN